mmetsp:Transcript_118769/g.206837  ORF Transcript_118769/g.206837 Transcript_118769/m.206837 type:complete len:342 (-) Transcript_118769:1166-2191(-)
MGILHLTQWLNVIWVVRAGQQWLLNLVEVNINDLRILHILVSLQEHRVGEPVLHGSSSAFHCSGITIALVDHPPQHGYVACQVLNDGLLVQLDCAPGSRPLSRGIRQLEGLLHLQIRQPLDFHDLAAVDVLLPLLLKGQQASLQGGVGNGIHQIPECDARLQFSVESDQNRFRHVQGHHSCGRSKGHETRAGGERNPEGEPRVGITTGANAIGQQHAIQPGVDDPVPGPQGHTPAGADEVREGRMGVDIHRPGVGGRVAEGLHHEVSAEAEASQVLQLIAGHRPCGVLGADGGHLRLAVGPRADTLHATSLAHHLLAQRVTLASIRRRGWGPEQSGGGQSK